MTSQVPPPMGVIVVQNIIEFGPSNPQELLLMLGVSGNMSGFDDPRQYISCYQLLKHSGNEWNAFVMLRNLLDQL